MLAALTVLHLLEAAASAKPPCSLNGVLRQGRCVCDPGWRSGATGSCELLNLADTLSSLHGTDLRPGDPTAPGNTTWLWGGSPIEVAGAWHLYFSEITEGCGLLHYQTNSVVRHATGPTISGPWTVVAALPALSPRFGHWDSGAVHGPSITRDPASGLFLLFYMGTTVTTLRPDCRANPSSLPVMNSSSRRIGLAWSVSLEPGQEQWHRAPSTLGGDYHSGMILQPRPNGWDSSDVSNAAPLILQNGTVLLGYRAGGDGVALGGGIGMAVADHWNGTYTRRGAAARAMLFSAEDGALWQDSRGNLHFFVHRFAAGNGSTAGAEVGGQ